MRRRPSFASAPFGIASGERRRRRSGRARSPAAAATLGEATRSRGSGPGRRASARVLRRRPVASTCRVDRPRQAGAHVGVTPSRSPLQVGRDVRRGASARCTRQRLDAAAVVAHGPMRGPARTCTVYRAARRCLRFQVPRPRRSRVRRGMWGAPGIESAAVNGRAEKPGARALPRSRAGRVTTRPIWTTWSVTVLPTVHGLIGRSVRSRCDGRRQSVVVRAVGAGSGRPREPELEALRSSNRGGGSRGGASALAASAAVAPTGRGRCARGRLRRRRARFSRPGRRSAWQPGTRGRLTLGQPSSLPIDARRLLASSTSGAFRALGPPLPHRRAIRAVVLRRRRPERMMPCENRLRRAELSGSAGHARRSTWTLARGPRRRRGRQGVRGAPTVGPPR